MGEYDRTGNGQSSKTDWDLRSILCDIAKNWWVILLIACSAAMITYTVMATVHKDRYTVKTTFAVMGRGVDANAASSLSATYEMAQKFEAILENTILKKKVMEELSLSSFPAKMNASIVPESNLMELSVTADSPEMAFRILKSVLNNYTSISDYIIPNVVLETLQQPQVSGVPSNQIPTKKYAATAFLAAALAMAALIGLFSFLRDTVKNEAEFTRKIDADLLGVVYHEKKKKNSSMLITNPARSFLYVESLKRIASRVRGRLDRKGGKVLLVTSVAENEGNRPLRQSRTVYCFWTAISDSRRYIKSLRFRKKTERISERLSSEKSRHPAFLRNTRIPTYIPESAVIVWKSRRLQSAVRFSTGFWRHAGPIWTTLFWIRRRWE